MAEKSKNKKSNIEQEEKKQQELNTENTKKQEVKEEENVKKEQQTEETTQQSEKEDDCEKKLAESQEKYMRLAAEYDNYRKRTMKEKMDLIKSGGEDVLVNILPVIDNFERALKAIDETDDVEAVKEGIHLIYKDFMEYLKQRGVTEIETVGQKFDTDLHEAVAQMPAQSEEQKGTVIDVIQKGYKLNGKVIRFAKVVVAQ